MPRFRSFLAPALLGSAAALAQQATSPPAAPSPTPTRTPTPITRTSYFNEAWLQAVVSLERVNADGTSRPIATGFLLQSEHQHIGLVTAKHVLFDAAGVLDPSRRGKVDVASLGYLVNIVGKSPRLIKEPELVEDGLGSWFYDERADVALRFFGLPDQAAVSSIDQELLSASVTLQVGAPLLVLGFPIGLRSADHPRAIARRGSIARVDASETLIDAFVFPGNSGGPVVYVPPVRFGGMLTSGVANEEHLVGVVSAYEPYRDVAYSLQTGEPRVSFQENTGLARVVPVEVLRQLLARHDVASLDAQIK